MELRAWILEDHASLAERFDHAVVRTVPLDRWRERADGGGSSIAWLLLHTALHEDLAVNVALRGRPPLRASWQQDLGVGAFPPHAGLGEAEDPAVTGAVDLDAVRAFATTVHADVHGWLEEVDPADLDATPPAGERIGDLAGVTDEEVPWLHAMWRDKPASWFVRWEAIGHRQNHIGEMISVRGRLGLSPF
jgi:hypothetical protein